MKDEMSTLERIHNSAKKEFLEKGFLSASLRNIVKMAGVTTGAFYGYYNSKEDLFDALVSEPAEHVLQFMNNGIDGFLERPIEAQTKEMVDYSQNMYVILLDYLYEHLDAFRLILMAAEGTRYSDFLDRMVEKESQSTYAYMSNLEAAGHQIRPIHEKVTHMVESGFITSFFEVVVHNMSKEEAREYVMTLAEFYTAGWEKLLGVKFGQ